jgi:hypothetical protein
MRAVVHSNSFKTRESTMIVFRVWLAILGAIAVSLRLMLLRPWSWLLHDVLTSAFL